MGAFSLNNHTLMEYYVYQHRAIDTNKIFYVGKGKGIRLELGKMFGLHKNTIHKIWRFERYKDVI